MCAHSSFDIGTLLTSRSCSVLENGMMTKHLKTCCIASPGMERSVIENIRHCHPQISKFPPCQVNGSEAHPGKKLPLTAAGIQGPERSEERRVGKEDRS